MEESSSIILSGRSDCKEAASALILGSMGRVYLVTQNLEAELYHDSEVYGRLSELATNNRNTDIRIIAHDTRVAAHQGHYLIHLAQRLPSFAQIRLTVTPQHRNFRESWLMADDNAYMRIRNPERFEGYYELDNKLECRFYCDTFLDMWEACEQDQNTRRLSL
jgi:hypothetical protein